MLKIPDRQKHEVAAELTAERKLLRAIADLVSLVEPRLLALWRDTGMTLAQRRILRRLRDGARSAGGLAASLGISAPSLTRMLTKLEKQGLITRTLDPTDRRRVQVELTAAGLRSLEGHRVFSGTSLLRAAKSLSAGRQSQVAEGVGELVRLARQLDVDE